MTMLTLLAEQAFLLGLLGLLQCISAADTLSTDTASGPAVAAAFPVLYGPECRLVWDQTRMHSTSHMRLHVWVKRMYIHDRWL